jgi:nucleotide-binding universal stress UspA family protein
VSARRFLVDRLDGAPDCIAPASSEGQLAVAGARTGAGDRAELFSEISGFLEQRWQEIDGSSGGRRHRPVLLPYTDSAPAQRGLETVVSLFDLVHPDVRVLHLREWIPARGGPFYVESSEDARSTLEDALCRLERAGIPATGLLGSAAQPRIGAEIAATALRMRASAVVLGTSRHPWLSRVLRGSVSSEVAYAAACPVILAGAPRGRAPGRPQRPGSPPEQRIGG